MEGNTTKRTFILAIILVLVIIGAGIYFLAGQVLPSYPSCKTMPCSTSTVASQQDTAIQPKSTEGSGVSRPKAYQPSTTPPLTLKALQYVPERAQIALGIPPVASLVERFIPFLQRFMPKVDFEHEMNLIATDLAKDMNVPEEGGLVGVLNAIGLDTHLGAAVFIDLEEAVQAFAEMTAKGETDELPDISHIKALLVLPVSNGENFEKALLKAVGDLLAGMETKEEEVAGTKIKLYGDLGGYFRTDAVVAVSNDPQLLRGAAARINNPAQFQYGSMACPAEDVHEAVILVFGDKFVPLMDTIVAGLGDIEPTLQMLLNAQREKFTSIYTEDAAENPGIIIFNVTNSTVELKAKIDTSVYPELAAYMGPARPLRWAQLLPVNTLTFLSLVFTEEAKKQITDVYLQSIPEEVRKRPAVSQGLMYGNSAMQLLGSEITLGITDFDPIDFPSIFLMVQVANTAGAQILLQLAPQVDHGEPYREVQIKMLRVPSPIPIYYVLVSDALILSNSDVGLKAIIDLVKDEKTSGLFEQLNPPILPDTPIYQAFVFKPRLYTDVIALLVPLTDRKMPEEVVGPLEVISKHFDDIRYLNEMQGTWNVGRITAILKTQ